MALMVRLCSKMARARGRCRRTWSSWGGSVVRRSLASTSGGKGLDADGDLPGSSATAASIFRRCPSKTPMSLRSTSSRSCAARSISQSHGVLGDTLGASWVANILDCRQNIILPSEYNRIQVISSGFRCARDEHSVSNNNPRRARRLHHPQRPRGRQNIAEWADD
jgi:hypothetical protein